VPVPRGAATAPLRARASGLLPVPSGARTSQQMRIRWALAVTCALGERAYLVVSSRASADCFCRFHGSHDSHRMTCPLALTQLTPAWSC
jgi:hypothetical protein